jgi:hypothetical protein
MDDLQAKRKRKELKDGKRWLMKSDKHFSGGIKRKEISEDFKNSFRAVKRSERNSYKQNIKREFGV